MDLLFFINIIALLFSFFIGGVLLGAVFSNTFRKKVIGFLHLKQLFYSYERLLLNKNPSNPILQPGTHPWNAEAVMNPAAIVLNGRTHLIYRAVGHNGISRLGYASSADGIVFDKILPCPIYTARSPTRVPDNSHSYSPTMYPSGGSWGGCEDPRMVCIDGRVYVTFNMFDGWDFIRVATISIDRDDFLAERFWKWEGPYIISRPGEIQKNWVLFPEKINGKIAILHSITPKIEIAYRDSIEDIGKKEPFIKSWIGSRNNLPAREGVWDTFVRGAGAPPVKTSAGWLLFYHANDAKEGYKYKVGAILLDTDDPTKILHRASLPVLSPDESYENNGKPGIVYVCGAVVRDGKLFVYYGGADKIVAVATVTLDEFIDALIKDSPLTLDIENAQTK